MSPVVVSNQRRTGCLVQLLWFIFIGWWAGQLWIIVAWLLMLTIIGIPIAVKMFNQVPQVMAMRGRESAITVVTAGRVTVVSPGGEVPQRSLLLRAVYFLLIGWWFSALWVEVGYILCLTIVGLPIGFWVFDRVPALLSLRR